MKTKSYCVSVCLVAVMASALLAAQSVTRSGHPSQSQNGGTEWAMRAMAALTGGNPVSSVTESGNVTLQSSGVMTNEIQITTGAGIRSEARTWDGYHPHGQWTGLDGQPHPMKLFNCWSDASWFFPPLSLLSDYADPNLVFADLGQQQYSGGTVEHIQVYRYYSGLPQLINDNIQQWSTVDYYLDSQTALPVALAFSGHAEGDLNLNLPLAIVFSQYQAVSGIQVPFQVTELLNGSRLLQVAVTTAAPNGQSSPIQKH
jgi:hypothetical protein